MRRYILSVDSRGITGLEISHMLKSIDVHITNIRDHEKTEDSIRKSERGYDLVIWTINAGEEDSLRLIEHLRKKTILTNIPVMVVSNCAERKSIVRAAESGALHYVVRPYNEDTVLKKLAGILRVNVAQPLNTIREDVITYTFRELMNREIKAASRGGYPLSIVSLMLEQGECIPGIPAQKAGEILAAALKSRLRDTDTVLSSNTGDVFILLPFSDKSGLETVKDKIDEIMSSHSVVNKALKGLLTRSISVVYPDDGRVMEDLLRKIERKMQESYIDDEN